MLSMIKALANKLPSPIVLELKRYYYAYQIYTKNFRETEPEAAVIPDLITAGDLCIDIGANIGTYTKLFSDLVGPSGRVIAFEPVPGTFSLLAANVSRFTHQNVSLVNFAVSDKLTLCGMSIPSSGTGALNYCRAELNNSKKSNLMVLTTPLFPFLENSHFKIKLVKIDVEGHESGVIKGMLPLIDLHHPALIVETKNEELTVTLSGLGYKVTRLPDSPNILCTWNS